MALHSMLIGCSFAVYLFIGQHVALVHFVKALYRIKELQSGDYMVISIDDFILDAEGNNVQKYTSAPDPYLSAMKEDDAIQAFRSVLKVTDSYPLNPDFRSAHSKQFPVSRSSYNIYVHLRVTGK